jgi:hypothetical protein
MNLEARTGAAAGPGERPTVETLSVFFLCSRLFSKCAFLINDVSYIVLI